VTAVLRELELESQLSVRGGPQPGFPVEPNTVDGDVLWLGPDEWLVIGGREADYPEAAAAVDVSASRVCFELAGDDVEDVLAQGCSLDLHPSVFAPGCCAQTVLARAQVILQRTGADAFRVYVRPSFAPYLRAWLEDAVTGPRSSLRRP
jgi:heterotetrameric sarcosine oxidase gamma subunit